MIDPKLNELPVTKSPSSRPSDPGSDSAAQSTSRREGLSIRDTVAGDATMSVGGTGVDTSGVRGGAGAAAGSSSLTPVTTASPAPNIVGATDEAGAATTSMPGVSDSYEDDLTYDEISARAYECWLQRGCPAGSPAVDWELASEQLRAERRRQDRSAAASA